MKKSPHLDQAWLRQKYEVEGLSTYDIGRLVGRDPKRIYQKLRDFGIPTRPRGLNLATTTDNYMLRPGAINPFLGKRHSIATRKKLSEKASVPKPYLRGDSNGMYGRTGADNPNYKGGISPERQRLYSSAQWKEIVRAVYERDNYCCIECGGKRDDGITIHVHHIKSWKHHPDLRFLLSNLVSLCSGCHRKAHKPPLRNSVSI